MDDRERKRLTMLMSEKLPTLRKESGMSQQALATLVGVSRSSIAKIETNGQHMTWNTYLSLILIFLKNEKTRDLLSFFGIYTEEVDKFLSGKSEKEVEK